jgi:hypothetical protein
LVIERRLEKFYVPDAHNASLTNQLKTTKKILEKSYDAKLDNYKR